MLTNFKKKLIVIGTLAASLSMAGCGLIGTSASRTEKPTADLVIYNAQITTQEKSLSTASALAIKGETILKVGDDEAVLDMVDDNTQVINANNRRLIPGLVDSHSHFLRSGLAYTRELRWDGVPSLKRGLEMIKEQAARTPEGEWVRVIGGWTPWQFSEKRHPTPAELNEVAPNTPVYIQYFYSVGIVNNKAMEILGIDQSTPDPHQGRFVRDAIGKPTGLMLAEPHPGIFYGKIAALPGTSKEVEANSTMHLFSELASFGLTGVIDAGGGGFNFPQEYNTAQQLAKDGSLAIRASFYLFAQRPQKELEDFRQWSDNHKVGTNFDPLKEHGFELDGAGEYILWEAADFENFRSPRPELPSTMEENLEPIIRLLVKRRWPFKFHATYDESIRRIIGVIERVNAQTPMNGLRWSIEHGETITPETIDRIHALGGGLAIQDRMVYLGDDFVERYGEKKAQFSPPLRYLMGKGIPLGIGTDATRGGSHNPWVSLHYLITGKTASGRQLYPSNNLLSREEALYVHTLGSAWFSGEETEKGRIVSGQLADLALLSDDFFSVPDEKIKSIRSVLTIVNGKVVYGDQEYQSMNPKLPEILPEWSPVKYYGSYWQ